MDQGQSLKSDPGAVAGTSWTYSLVAAGRPQGRLLHKCGFLVQDLERLLQSCDLSRAPSGLLLVRLRLVNALRVQLGEQLVGGVQLRLHRDAVGGQLRGLLV